MPLDIAYEYNVWLGILSILLLLGAGSISGLFYWSSKEAEEDRPAILKNNKVYFALKIGEYSILVVSLYFLFTSMGWVTTTVAYLLMEYRWHQIMKPMYKKYFGIPTEKAVQAA